MLISILLIALLRTILAYQTEQELLLLLLLLCTRIGFAFLKKAALLGLLDGELLQRSLDGSGQLWVLIVNVDSWRDDLALVGLGIKLNVIEVFFWLDILILSIFPLLYGVTQFKSSNGFSKFADVLLTLFIRPNLPLSFLHLIECKLVWSFTKELLALEGLV